MSLIHLFKSRLSFGRLVMFTFLFASLMAGAGCKSQKKAAAEAAAKERAMLEERKAEARSMLLDIMEDDNLSLEEKERLLQEVKDMNLNDPEIDRMIARAEEHLATERRLAERDREGSGNSMTREAQLEQQFGAIANASSTAAANQSIQQTLSMFSGPDALVLIIIYKDADNTDYDEPTNITKYLNYLKDQQQTPHSVDKIVLDDNGKIKELELIKD
ncbi:hypothetical protein AB9P05_18110 [Roseivirga sp. BDSF3-8]|uniref:hypothetical protein n=1 Tax=Roseivirga sp. BDSF3-8 TaxID=3241598 RepID=UPI0035322649